MLVTQNQSSLSWNSSFSRQEQGNSNETFKLEFPSSNVEINSAVNSATAVNSAVSSATAVSQATAYGYSVDSKGFMGADFNAAAGISENVKIHSKTIEQLTTHAKNIGFNGSAAQINKKAWSNFSQIIGDESALRGEKSR